MISKHNIFRVLFVKTAYVYFTWKFYIYSLALELAISGNQQCANCIGTLLFRTQFHESARFFGGLRSQTSLIYRPRLRFCNTDRPPRHENTQTYRLPRKETLMSTVKKFRIPRNCCMYTHVLASAHIHTPTRTLMHRKHRLPRNQNTRKHSTEDQDSSQLLYNAHTSSQLRTHNGLHAM